MAMQAISYRFGRCLLMAAFLLFAGFVAYGEEEGPVDSTPPPDKPEPAWLTGTVNEAAPRQPEPARESATWRSMGALLLVVGVLIGAHYFLRRREPAWTRPSQPLKVVGRMRLGFRQDLVIVEWDGEHMALAVGSSFIRCLHVRQAARDGEENTELPSS